MDSRYPIIPWRPYFDIAFAWAVIAVSVYFSAFVSPWFYPVSCLLIANRILALSLLCHEALHRTLHSNARINDFLGRYFCAFPTLISFSKYRRLHLLHHSAVGSENWDPDRHLYRSYPLPMFLFIGRLLARVLTFRNALDFVDYYSEFPEAFRRKRIADGSLFIFSQRSDFLPFVIFQTVVVFAVYYFGVWQEFALLYFVPLLCITQPYVILMGGLQHGPIKVGQTENVSRTVSGSKLYLWLLLPLDINYHAEHHLDPSIPHYWLKKKSKDLQAEGVTLWSESYRKTVDSLFAR